VTSELARRFAIPIDADSLYQSLGYYTDVWSPDLEFLVLPLGRFEGYAVFKSAKAMTEIAAGKPNDFIRIQSPSGIRFWHKFGQWVASSSFEFEAGLSDDFGSFGYAASARSLNTKPSKITSFVGVNADGPIAGQAKIAAGHLGKE
jgi:hypothetical protein